MKISLKQAFNFADGRLSTSIQDVYVILNQIYGNCVQPHEIGRYRDKLSLEKPQWLIDSKNKIEQLKKDLGTDNFYVLMRFLSDNKDIDILK